MLEPVGILERDQQLAVLSECLDQARLGTGRLVWVEGEAGVGKSTLVNHFCAGVRGARVVVGSCDPTTTPRPLGPVLDIVRRLEVIPDAGRAPARDAVVESFVSELAARSWVTVAVIEDVHWADAATLDLLRFVGRRITGQRGLVVATLRDDEVGPDHPLRAVLGDLATTPGVIRLSLPPLSEHGVAALVAAHGLSHAVEAGALHARTGGNPFYVTEVLADAGSRGRVDAGQGVPATVRDAVLARVARRSPAARVVLEAASVAPGRIETWLLERLAGATADGLDECVTAGVLTSAGPGHVAFRHELARLAVHESVPPARRADLHARVVELLLERYGEQAEPSRIAAHGEAAGASEVARDWAMRAAEQATRLGAYRQAAEQYARALRHADGLADGDLADLLERYVPAVSRVDDIDAAAQAAQRALALRRRLGDPVALGRSLCLSARTLWDQGHSADAAAVGREAVATLQAAPPGPELAEAHAVVAGFAMLARDHATAQVEGARAIRLAETLGADHILAHALNVVGASRLVTGDAGGVADLRRSIFIAEAADLPDLVSLGWLNLGSGAGEVRDLVTAEPALREAVAYAAARDLDHRRHYAQAWLARVLLERGVWDDAEVLAKAVVADGPRIAVPSRIVALGVLGRLWLRRGDADAGPVLQEAWELAGHTGDLQRLWPIAAARAEAAWLQGRQEAIGPAVQDTFELARRLGLAWAMGELGLWLRRAGRTDPVPVGAARPWALHAAGRWREAARAWEDLGCPYEAADALADSDDPDDLRASLATLERLGAAAAAQRVRRRLRGLGIRDVPRGPRRTTVNHPAGLTPRQAEVLELVALGLSDAQIAGRLHLSTKTVGHHVSAVLHKLEVASRGEAVHRARALGVLGEVTGP